MKGWCRKQCGCRGPDGKRLSTRCPDLAKRHHGKWAAECRIEVTGPDGGTRQWTLSRGGFPTKAKAEELLTQVSDLMRLATDEPIRRKIGDMIRDRTKRGGVLPPRGCASADRGGCRSRRAGHHLRRGVG